MTNEGPVKLIEWVKIALLFYMLRQNCPSLRIWTCLGSSTFVCQRIFKKIYQQDQNNDVLFIESF